MVRTMAFLRWVRAHLKMLAWSLAAIFSAIFFGWYELTKKKAPPIVLPNGTVSSAPKPITFQDVARDKIEDAQSEAHVEAEIAKSKSDEQRTKLDEIKKIDDPIARRQQLAVYLDQNL